MKAVCLGGALASLWFFGWMGRGLAQGVTTIRVTAAPEVVLADGISASIIRADVRDQAGLAAPDGTEVVFQTTLGTIPPAAQTVGGVAEATLLSPTEPGVATVTASYGNVRSEAEVEFVAERETSSQESNVIAVDAGWVGYYVGQRMLVGLQDVRMSYRGWEVEAKTSLFLDVEKLEVLAREVRLTTSRGQAEGFSVRARFVGADLKGHLLAIGEEMGLYEFGNRSLALERADEALTPELFWPPERQDSSFWVKARRALVFPGEKIAFRRAELYFGQTRLLTMPYYVLPLDSFSAPLPEYVNYSSLGGLSVNIPWHYAVTDRRTGVVRVERGRRTNWFSQRPGWSVSIEEGYSAGAKQGGEVRLDGLLRNDWGAYWNHHQRYVDGSNAYFSLGYPSNSLVYGSATWFGRREGYTFAARADGSKMPGQPVSYDVTGSWRSFARPLGKGKWNYYGTFDLGLGTDLGTERVLLRQEERLAVFPRQVPLGRSTSLSLRTDLSFRADSSGARGREWVGRLGIDQTLGKGSRLSLAYLYQERRGDAFLPSPPRQQLSASLFWGGGPQAGGYLNSTYDLSSGYLNAFAGISHSFSEDWKIDLRSQYLKFPAGDYVDNEVSLVKNMGGRAAALMWSQSRHTLWFELLPGGF